MGTDQGADKGEKIRRWSVKQKERVVLRLLRGEPLEVVTREEGVSAQQLVQWREDFLAGGRENLKSRPGDPNERQLREAERKIGELTMKLELLEGKGQILRRGRRSRC